MLKNAVLKQKEEKQRLLSLHYIKRTKLAEAKKWIDSDLIKVVLGPRRAGKSVFAFMLLKDRPFAYFNFDDETVSDGKFDYDGLLQELNAAYGKTKHILFDEIQNLPKWELFVSRLHREGYNLVLTGSNANLLSRELSTALTGRHIPIEILPFDFKEYLRAKQYDLPAACLPVRQGRQGIPRNGHFLPEKKGHLLNLLEQYLFSGGYPEIAVKNLEPKEYLSVLFDSLLFKDVIKRHQIRFSGQIDDLGSYLISNVSNQYSLRKLAAVLKFKSGVTLEKYISYLIEAYLIFLLHRYSYKAGERLKSPKKIYTVDNGFIQAKAVQHSKNNGKLLENVMFIELVKKGHEPNRELFYYKTRNDREIDFVLKKGAEIIELIQVAYDLNISNTEQREIKALVEGAQELKCGTLTIITWDEKKAIVKDGRTINFTPVWERLLG